MRARNFQKPLTLSLRHYYIDYRQVREEWKENKKVPKKRHELPVDALATIEAKDCQRRLIIPDVRGHVLQIARLVVCMGDEVKESLLPPMVGEMDAALQSKYIQDGALNLWLQRPKHEGKIDYYLRLMAWSNEFVPIVRDIADGVDRLRNMRYGTWKIEERLRNDNDLERLRHSLEELTIFWYEDSDAKFMSCIPPLAVRG